MGPPLPQGKVIGDSFPVDRNSKILLVGQVREEVGPWPDRIYETPYFSFLKSEDLPDYTI